MEASALPASVGLARTRISIGASLLRLRSDEQLVSLFRAGNEEAFRIIHDRYRQRLFAYTRQMLAGSPQDAEDALQEIFVRAYAGLRANDRQLALRAWLYRVAHNRCIDELRRPPRPAPEVMDCLHPPAQDPATKVEQRDALRRLIADVQRLPDQQRSALLMRELGGMPYADLAGALGVTIPAVKSLLVRARVGLAQASEARDVACPQIREELILAHDRGVRASGVARRHMRDCRGCREFRTEVRGVSRQFAALAPALGPAGVLAKLLGLGGGASGGAAAGGGAAAAGGAVGAGGAIASAGALASGASHVVTLLAAAVITAGGAVEVQQTISPPVRHHARHHRVVTVPREAASPPAYIVPRSAPQAQIAAAGSAAPAQPVTPPAPSRPAVKKVARVPSMTQPSSVKSASAAPAVPSSMTSGSSTGPASSTTATGESGTGSAVGSSTSAPAGTTPATGSTTTAPAATTTGSSGSGSTETADGSIAGSAGSSSTGTGVDGTAGSASSSTPTGPAASVAIGSGTGSSGASGATAP